MNVLLSRWAGWVGWMVVLSLALVRPAFEAAAQVAINEVMADNRGSLANEGEFPDWVELYNPTANTVLLSGMGLTDNQSQPAKYVFPTGTALAPGEMLIVFLDSSTGLPGLHAGFSLDNKGELMALYRAPASAGNLMDLVVFGLQAADFSLGRIPDGTGGFVLNVPTPSQFNTAALLSATTNLFINEWMANDSPREDWIELYNSDEEPVALAGTVFTDSTGALPSNRAIPALSFIGGESFLQFFADNLSQGNGADHLDFRLSDGGETVTLYAPDRSNVLNRVVFAAQTLSVSQGRLPDGGGDVVSFPLGRNTPAASNFLLLTNVLVNEVLAHTDPPLEDAIELINATPVQVDISHWWISDSRSDPKKFRIPAGTTIVAGGLKVIYEYQFNPDRTGNTPSFTLNSSRGDDVFLSTGDALGRLTGFRGVQSFPASQNGVSFGRHTNSQGLVEFIPMSRRSFGFDNPFFVEQFRTGIGLPNPRPMTGPLLITEIMYHPADSVPGQDNFEDEYIEIFNATNRTVLFYDPFFPANRWKLRGGVNYDFPSFRGLAGGESALVVAFNPLTNPTRLIAFRNKFKIPSTVQMFGPFQGKLDNREETLDLFKPDTPQGPGHPDEGLVPYLYDEHIQYEDRFPWPSAPDGGGFSLTRLRPEDYGNDPVHWAPANPTPGWQVFSIDSVRLEGSELVLRFRSLAGMGYTVQYKTLPEPGQWFPMAIGLPEPQTEVKEVRDPFVPFEPSRIYRVVIPMQ